MRKNLLLDRENDNTGGDSSIVNSKKSLLEQDSSKEDFSSSSENTNKKQYSSEENSTKETIKLLVDSENKKDKDHIDNAIESNEIQNSVVELEINPEEIEKKDLLLEKENSKLIDLSHYIPAEKHSKYHVFKSIASSSANIFFLGIYEYNWQYFYRKYRAFIIGILLTLGFLLYTLVAKISVVSPGQGVVTGGDDKIQIVSPTSGYIQDFELTSGQPVKQNQILYSFLNLDTYYNEKSTSNIIDINQTEINRLRIDLSLMLSLMDKDLLAEINKTISTQVSIGSQARKLDEQKAAQDAEVDRLNEPKNTLEITSPPIKSNIVDTTKLIKIDDNRELDKDLDQITPTLETDTNNKAVSDIAGIDNKQKLTDSSEAAKITDSVVKLPTEVPLSDSILEKNNSTIITDDKPVTDLIDSTKVVEPQKNKLESVKELNKNTNMSSDRLSLLLGVKEKVDVTQLQIIVPTTQAEKDALIEEAKSRDFNLNYYKFEVDQKSLEDQINSFKIRTSLFEQEKNAYGHQLNLLLKKSDLLQRSRSPEVDVIANNSEISRTRLSMISAESTYLDLGNRLKDIERTYFSQLQQRSQDIYERIQSLSKENTQKNGELDLLKEKMLQSSVRSPVDGQVLTIEKNLTQGSFIESNQVIMTIKKDLDSAIIKARIEARYRPFIDVNGDVEIVIDSPGFRRSFMGKISKISVDSFTIQNNSQQLAEQRFYDVEITPDNGDDLQNLYEGIPSRVYVQSKEISIFSYITALFNTSLVFNIW